MNKIINLGILTIFCISLFGQIYAEENLADNYNADTDEIMCAMDVMICPDGTAVSRLAELNCEFVPCPQLDPESNTETDATENCREEIEEINLKIKEISQRYETQLRELKRNYEEKLNRFNQAKEEFTKCINQKAVSRLTGNLGVASADSIMVEQKVTMISNTQAEKSVVSEDFILDNDAVVLIDSLSTIPESTISNCEEQRIKAKQAHEEVLREIENIRMFKEEKQTEIRELENFKQQRNEMLRRCNVPSVITKVVCEIPEELIVQKKELENRLTELQNNFIGTSNNKEEDKEFINKYQELKKEHRLIEEKINALRRECEKPQFQVDGCNDVEIINNIAELKRLLVETKDDREAYALKTKLEYYEGKLNRCNQVSKMPEVNLENSEIEMYRAQISELKSKIANQNEVIKDLKSQIQSFSEEFKNAGEERKTEMLANNAEKISEHTIEIIDKRILKLEEIMSNIEANTLQENKEEEINALIERIAELKLVKSNLELAMTPQDLREAINSAKEQEIKAINQNRVFALEKSAKELNRIINKHFSNNQTLNLKITEFSEKIEQLDATVSKEEIDLLIEEYKTLKEEVRTEERE